MISINFLKNSARVQNALGAPVQKTAPKLRQNSQSPTMQFKNKVFNQQHHEGLISVGMRDFLCGECELRNAYINKCAQEAYAKEADLIKGIL